MIRLTLKTAPEGRLTLEALTPERLNGRGGAAIERLPLAVGNAMASVGDWFRVEPGEADTVAIAGAGDRLDCIGAGMTRGRIVVEGNAGAYLGRELQGGAIRVEGSAGFGAATAMVDGTIRIAGDAGDRLGGSLPGASGGMQGGVVIVGGAAGAGCGYHLRRGLIAVAGGAGPGCGGRMRAGTIVIGGRVAEGAGAAMRRGSLIALDGFARLGPTFADCGTHDLGVLRLLARMLADLALGALAARLGPMRRLVGDQAVGGKGELLSPG